MELGGMYVVDDHGEGCGHGYEHVWPCVNMLKYVVHIT